MEKKKGIKKKREKMNACAILVGKPDERPL
jgi:hypothetical protein